MGGIDAGVAEAAGNSLDMFSCVTDEVERGESVKIS